MVDDSIERELATLRDMYCATPSDQEIDAALARTVRPGGSRTRGQRRGPRRGLVMVLGAIAMLASGVAIGAERGVLFSDAPTSDRMHVLGEAAPDENRIPSQLADKYKVLDWPVPLDAAGDDHARVLIDYQNDGLNFQLVAVPTRNANTLCYGISTAHTGAEHPEADSRTCGGFRSGWPLVESVKRTAYLPNVHYGIAADEVAQVRFLVGGDLRDATMGQNSYAWVPRAGETASGIEVELRDGTVARRDLGSQLHDPYQQPYIVRGATK